MSRARLLISIGAEGGSIALYGDIANPSLPRFRLCVVDQTPMFLSDDEAGTAIRSDSGWLSSWADAMAALGRYPWVNLVPLHVDAAISSDVWKALEDYIARTKRSVRETALSRWRIACRQANT
jgi:hypothetical protein